MRTAIIIGALMCCMGSTQVFAEGATLIEFRAPTHGRLMLTEATIARAKASLRLTRTQEQYWSPVEAALHEIAREQAATISEWRGARAGFGSLTIDNGKLQRLVSIATPLFFSLDENQRREAAKLARALGLENVASAL